MSRSSNDGVGGSGGRIRTGLFIGGGQILHESNCWYIFVKKTTSTSVGRIVSLGRVVEPGCDLGKIPSQKMR